MGTYTELMMKEVEVKPEIHKEMGRDVDGDGNLASWYIEEIYPEFTESAQLNIIKLIGSKIDYMSYFDKHDNEWHICANQRFNPTYWHYLCVNKDYSEALAELVCQLIDDKVLNKDEVKGVLE